MTLLIKNVKQLGNAKHRPYFFRNRTKFVKYTVKLYFSNKLNSVQSTGKII